ncbi:hypothetical protein [Streptomyces sp. CBMA152]|uniref:hypothetical protein n=1 Tax=Streptomyces sp. CBMA152 TaxID=1896312 RepID=UPI00166165A4|nr:hypothetical protein [Streptomyces sp. CBMA152]
MTHSTAASEVTPVTSAPVFTPMVAQVVPLRRDTAYAPKTGVARMPVEVQFRDGTTVRTDLVMSGSQLYAANIQTGRAVEARESARALGQD